MRIPMNPISNTIEQHISFLLHFVNAWDKASEDYQNDKDDSRLTELSGMLDAFTAMTGYPEWSADELLVELRSKRDDKAIILEVEGASTTLDAFIIANTGDDVEPLEESEMEKVRELKVGESCFLSAQGGYTEIKRTI